MRLSSQQQSQKFAHLRAGALLLSLAFAGAWTLTLSSCSKTESVTVEPNFTSIYTNVLSTGCVTCHQPEGSGSSTGAHLDFTSQAQAYNTIFSAVSGASSGACVTGAVHNVVSGSPGTSYLLAVIDSSYSTSNYANVSGCTPLASHSTGGYASDAAKSAILAWITNGAANN